VSAEVDGGDEEHAAVGQVAGNPEDHDGNVKRNDEGEIKQIFRNLSIYYKNTSRDVLIYRRERQKLNLSSPEKICNQTKKSQKDR
jgi:hypothetical protein